jgi:membrane protein implicated in regulation of membrane protease activity
VYRPKKFTFILYYLIPTIFMAFLFLITVAWVYVVLLMAATESSFLAGVMTFLFYCVIPLSLVLYILSAPARKKRIKEAEEQKRMEKIQKP